MRTLVILLLCSFSARSQLTVDQKIEDFKSLSGIYAKRYAPYDWKKTIFGFDALNIAPWLDRVSSTTNDLDFYELMVEYVADLHDSHAYYQLPSTFFASLNITVDIYDGKVLIDNLNRPALPLTTYPFQVGDEVVSVDGTAAADLIQAFSKYVQLANMRATQRRAASRIVMRPQNRMPHAISVADSATVVIQRQTGALETYSLPWVKSGVPLTQIGPVPSPSSVSMSAPRTSAVGEDDGPDPLASLQNSKGEDSGELSTGSLTPVFALPNGFVQRLGKAATDYFYSGTFPAGGKTIGFIRIPRYDPPDQAAALAQFASEIAFFQASTDGLIVDEMRNPGGQLCYGESIASFLIPNTFRPIGYQIRPTWDYVVRFDSALQSAKRNNAAPSIIDQYQGLYNAIRTAYDSNRGLTDPVPFCGASFERQPAKDGNGNILAYQKPLILLTDEFSSSTADSVAAVLQDNQRGQIVGYRTNGAGGNNSLAIDRFQAGEYSEGDTGVTLALMVRKNPITTDDFPATAYIENVGVRPDVQIDYMTTANLLQRGTPFFDAVTAALLAQM
ncbi:MAG: S41 family peptidase [Bryobacteraceae bacterium]